MGIELDLTPGVLVAPQVIALMDSNGDGQISEEEAQAYARRVLSEVRVEVEQQPYSLVPTAVVLPPMLNLTAGVGMIRVEATLSPDGTQRPLRAGPHEVTVWNGHAPVKSVYQSAVVLQRAGAIEVGQQTRDDLQQSLRVDYSVVAPTQAAGSSAPTPNQPALLALPEQQQWVLDALAQPAQSPGLPVLALLLSAALGGQHSTTFRTPSLESTGCVMSGCSGS